MRFGIYLMRRGVITAAELVEALEEQMDSHPTLGQLAIEEGMMTVRQVFEVLRAQATSSRQRFGDTAMQLGMLDRAQIADLLLLQADRIPPMEKVLVQLGIMDQQQAENELAAYRRDMERTGAQRGDAYDTPSAFLIRRNEGLLTQLA